MANHAFEQCSLAGIRRQTQCVRKLNVHLMRRYLYGRSVCETSRPSHEAHVGPEANVQFSANQPLTIMHTFVRHPTNQLRLDSSMRALRFLVCGSAKCPVSTPWVLTPTLSGRRDSATLPPHAVPMFGFERCEGPLWVGFATCMTCRRGGERRAQSWDTVRPGADARRRRSIFTSGQVAAKGMSLKADCFLTTCCALIRQVEQLSRQAS